MRKGCAILTVFTVFAACGSELASPRVGWFRDRSGTVRSVLGIGGNLFTGDATGSGVLSAASSGRFLLIKTTAGLEWRDGEGRMIETRSAPPGPALFAFDQDGVPSLAYFSETGEFSPRPPTRVFGQPADEVLAIARPRPDRFVAVLRRDGTLVLVSATGDSVQETELTGGSPPALLLADGTALFRSGEALAIRQQSGAERQIALPGAPVELNLMGACWVHVRLAPPGGDFALRVLERHELYRIPEAPR